MDQPQGAPLVSHMIMDARPSNATEKALRKELNVPKSVDSITLSVFEVRLDGYAQYCCWAGGKVQQAGAGAPPLLTAIGAAAAEALTRLPFLHRKGGQIEQLVVQELRLGPTPLQDKVLAALRQYRDHPICFVGDLAGELDGKMALAFNLTGMPLTVAECAGPGPLVLQ